MNNEIPLRDYIGGLRILTDEQIQAISKIRDCLRKYRYIWEQIHPEYDLDKVNFCADFINTAIEIGYYSETDAKILNELRQDYIEFQKNI